MPGELYIPYSALKPLIPIFPLVRQAAEGHILNDYDGIGEVRDPGAGRRRTRAQYLNFAQLYGVDAARELLHSFETTNK